jgi:hypothetical protein
LTFFDFKGLAQVPGAAVVCQCVRTLLNCLLCSRLARIVVSSFGTFRYASVACIKTSGPRPLGNNAQHDKVVWRGDHARLCLKTRSTSWLVGWGGWGRAQRSPQNKEAPRIKERKAHWGVVAATTAVPVRVFKQSSRTRTMRT